MNFATDAGEKVMCTMNKNMACLNLLLRIIEYWNYAHERNIILADLVEFLTLDYCTSRCRLNLTAALWTSTTTASIDKDSELNENKGNDVLWKTTPSKKFKNKRNSNSEKKGDKVCIGMNRCSWLSEILGNDEEINQELREIEVKDKIHWERIKIKKIEKK